MHMEIEVIIRFTQIGYHRWNNAPVMLEFLRCLHRHTFYIECRKLVSGEDREIEIIIFKDQVSKYLRAQFKSHLDGINFENGSCETIARILAHKFDLTFCQVLEDNENGAIVKK